MNSRQSRGSVARLALYATCITLVPGCTAETADIGTSDAEALPRWSYDSTMVFPADLSLSRPEDGIALTDGRLIVTDQVHGLRVVETDGSSAPFGDLPGNGYIHDPPAHSGGANGVTLEPDGTHLLVTDVFGGAIYRVDVRTGGTERVYQHRYGINTAVRDTRGAIWFTQSTLNTPEAGEGRLWAAVDIPRADGALLRLAAEGDDFAQEAEIIVDSLVFANGLAIDEPGGHLYVAETMGNRLLRYRVDLDGGRVSERTVFVDGVGPDNIELDDQGLLWLAVPGSNEVLVVNTATGERHSVFRSLTPAQEELVEEFVRRGREGVSRMELLTPAVWHPLPGSITGVILGPPGQPVYITGLGNALLRLVP